MSSKTKTTATKEEATPVLVPKLRFPEFRQAEGWKARTQAELALMADLFPLLTKRAGSRDISGLSAYEQ